MNPLQAALNFKRGAEQKIEGFGRVIGRKIRSGLKAYDQAGQNLVKTAKQNGVQPD